jgi:hypothetical protein
MILMRRITHVGCRAEASGLAGERCDAFEEQEGGGVRGGALAG